MPGAMRPTLYTIGFTCSEHEPDTCRRRLLAERLAAAWPGLAIVHLI